MRSAICKRSARLPFFLMQRASRFPPVSQPQLDAARPLTPPPPHPQNQ